MDPIFGQSFFSTGEIGYMALMMGNYFSHPGAILNKNEKDCKLFHFIISDTRVGGILVSLHLNDTVTTV